MKRLLIASAALLPVSTAAFGQEGEPWRVRVGAGIETHPKYIGADKNELGPLWDFDFARGSEQFSFEAPDDHFGIPLVSNGGFRIGPAVRLGQKRKDSDVGLPLGKVSRAFEVGAFADYEIANSFRVRGELLKALGGHKGLFGSLGADKIWRDGDRYVFSVGPRLLFSDKKYQRAYFGVTPAAALATGLPVYTPDGGIHGVAATAGASYQFDPRWGLFGYGRLERLVGDAAKSPIVQQLGSRNQMSAGVGVSYTFQVPR